MADSGRSTRRAGGVSLAELAVIAVGVASIVLGQSGERSSEPMPKRAGPQPGQGKSDEQGPLSQGRGREAESPRDIPAKGWKDILWRVWQQIQEDRVVAIAAGVTFYLLLALFPAIAAFVSIYGLFADPATIQSHFDQVKTVFPYGAADILGEQLKAISAKGSGALGLASTIAVLASVWSANSGTKALLDALNIAYGEEEKRSFVRLNAVALAFTVGIFVFLMLALAAVAIVPLVLNFLPHGVATDWIAKIGRWVVMFALLVLGLALLYRYGPSRAEPRWQWVTVGSVVAAIVWVIASIALSIYAQNFAHYDKTYGSLGAAIGFMIWLWVSCIIILIGAELNAEIEHQTVRDSTKGGEKPLGARGARMADTVGKAAD